MTLADTFITQAIPNTHCTTFVTNRHITLEKALKTLDIPINSIIEMEQTHEDGICIANQTTPSPVKHVDALITQEKHVPLIVRTADCLPILIYHPTVIAGIHAGRKSTDLNILEKVLMQLKTQFNVVDNLQIYFGPHICKANYEINPNTRDCYDLREKNIDQLNRVFTSQAYMLYDENICTLEHNDTYFSFRKEGENAGRFYSGILLR